MKRRLPRGLVVRSTLTIIVLALGVGLLFAIGAAWALQAAEKERLQQRLDEVLATVQSTVSIACFVRDEALAREIVAGLMVNHAVLGVRITADGRVLHEQLPPPQEATGTFPIQREVHSPFDVREKVGEITLHASSRALQAQAWNYTRYVLLALAAEVALVAIAVAWVVFSQITRPIKRISDDLHGLPLRAGTRLRVSRRNLRDELGRLVVDINALLVRLTGLVDTERLLRLDREASERRLAQIFEKVDAGIFEVDHSGLLHSWNPAFTQMLGTPPEPPRLQALLPEHGGRVLALIDDCLRSGQQRDADLAVTAPQGELWIEISLTPVDAEMLQGVIIDITERKQAELAAQRLATRDTLTGLLNRRGLDAELAPLLARDDGGRPSLALLFIDLDHFKDVNDHHGHAAGDAVLCRVARVLERAVRQADRTARIGGDEFIVVLVDVDAATADEIAHTIAAGIAQPGDIEGASVRVGASVGIALARDGETAAQLQHRADAAMYAAKQAGRGQVRAAA